ncbi:MAG: FAD-dependent oxidoreductase, partial [Methylococcales bacterium]
MSSPGQRIAVIGAGLAGPLLSLYLAKRGFVVDVYERRPDLRKTGISAGRSINLALSARGIHALKEVGLYNEIMNAAIPMRGRMMHALDGELTFQPYGKDETEVIYSISRTALNIALLNASERHRNVSLHFTERCTGMDLRTGEVHLHNEDRNIEFTIHPECAIAADGSGSAIRTEMLKLWRFDFTQTHLEYGYKELTIPASAAEKFRMEKNALHIWPRKTFMLIALPNTDGSFTCIFFFPFEGEESFKTIDTEEKIVNFFRTQFPDANALMPQC